MTDRRLLSVSAFGHLAEAPEAAPPPRIQRYLSEPKRHRLETRPTPKLQPQTSLPLELYRLPEPCIRRNHDTKLDIRQHRTKKVVFAETPCVIWNDDPPLTLFAQRSQLVVSSGGGEEAEEADVEEVAPVTAKERRRRKVVTAVAFTTFVLLTASALFVLITLFHASAIDEVGT